MSPAVASRTILIWKALYTDFHVARCIFMLHFDLEKTKSTCRNLAAKGWGWDLGQELSNCQATRQVENFES